VLSFAFQLVGLVCLGVLGGIGVVYLLRYPAICFALFTFSYVLKGGMQLSILLNLTTVLLVITLIGVFLPAFVGRRTSFRLQMSDLWLWGFVVLLIAGSFLAPELGNGALKALRFFILVFVPYMLARISLKDHRQVKLYLTTIFTMTSIIALFVVVVSFIPRLFAGLFPETLQHGRLIYFAANPVPVGTFFMVGLVLAVVGAFGNLFEKWRCGKWYCLVMIFVLFYAISLTGTRGPMVAAMTAIAVYFLSVLLRKPARGIAIGIIAITFVGVLYISPTIREYIPHVSRYQSLLGGGRDLSVQLRLGIQQKAVAQFLGSPLFGVGTGGLGEYPHNLFLEVAAENGILGLLVFLGFLTAVANRVFIYLTAILPKLSASSKSLALAVLLVGLALFIEKQFSFDLTMHKDLFAFLGLAVNLPLIARTARQPKRSTAQ